MKKLCGVITVYAGVITVLIIAVVLALLESARFYVCDTAARRYADMAAEMTFSHYSRPLADRYDLFAFDAGSGYERLGMFNDMLSRNLEKKEGGRFLSMYAAQVGSAQIEHKGIEADDWDPLMQQIRKYEKNHMADAAAVRLKELIADYRRTDSEEGAKNYAEMIRVQGAQQEQAEAEDAAQASSSDGENTQKPEPDKTGSDVSDPRKGVGRWLKGELLEIIMGDNPVSQKSVDLSACTFRVGEEKKTEVPDEFEDYREAGDDLDEQTGMTAGDFPAAADDLLVDIYILDKFGSLRGTPGDEKNAQQESVLDYEQEFIVFGHDSDEENLESAFASIDGMRMMLNLLYLRTDPERVREITELSTAIGAATALPGASLILNLLITVCWAGAESAVDCAALADGKQVPLLKDRNSWNLSLENLDELADKNNASDFAKDNDGLTYEQYLTILLAMVPKETKIIRMLDLMELNTQQADGGENFSFAGNVVEAQFAGSVETDTAFRLWNKSVQTKYSCHYAYVSDQTAAADE